MLRGRCLGWFDGDYGDGDDDLEMDVRVGVRAVRVAGRGGVQGDGVATRHKVYSVDG